MRLLNKHLRFLLILLGAGLVTAGCAHEPSETRTPPVLAGGQAAATALTLVGTPYRYGGEDLKGVDCSGLVYYSYKRAGVRVPRTTGELKRAATPVRKMRKGDLVFFKQYGRRYSHVGIYIGDDKFVHAPSTGKRVRTDSLLSPYWAQHFLDARRFYP
jgi:cell wall-associated NlpC family hydrolase